MWKVALGLGCTLLFGATLIEGFVTGTMRFFQPALIWSGRRRDQPVRFWLIAAWLAFLTISCAIATIYELWFPDGVSGAPEQSGASSSSR